MMRTMIVAAVFPLFISVHGPIMAANLEFDMQIKCRVDESRSLTNQKQYHGAKKAMRIQSWFSHWLFNDDNYSKNSAIEFNWTPWTPNGPSLKIAADNTVHNSIRLLPRTKDSLIAVTSASDTLTAEGWLFSLNFRHEAVIATQIQTNIGGVKGKVVVYACEFINKNRQIEAPEPKDSVG